ncbi:MAG: alpha-amylase family glycosyl hydrolase [Terracoccus sp.]
MAEWTQNVIWWHVYPLGALGADTTGHDRSPEPRLRRLVPWLDHLIVLGANGLALGPVFASSTHGYDTIDYLVVDPRLGTSDDLAHLVDEAHRRGIRVMLDGVFNHVGPEFPALVAALHDPDLPDAALFRHDPDGSLATFEGHGGLIALDHDSPRTADLVVEVMTHWLDLGVDAWRLDAAYSVPTPFWAGVLPRVRERHPDAYVVGEVLHGDYADIVAQGTLDSVTQYELWQAIWHGLQSANFHELAWALKRHNTFLETFVPYTFVGNHDVTRIASQIDDERHHAHATVLLFLLGGTPAVYYGDEVGLTGVKQERFGGDDAIRPALPADPDELTRANPAVFALHQQLIGLRRRLPWLHRATSTSTTVDDRQLVLEVSSGDDLLVVALNIGDETLVVDGAWEVLEASDAVPDDRTVRVGPHGWAVLAPGS